MKDEDFNCKFPPLYLGKLKKHGNTEEEGGKQRGRNFLMGGVGLFVSHCLGLAVPIIA
jgi:hypothetical protein